MLPHTLPGKTSIPKAFPQSGFTIMELTVVLVIVALLLGRPADACLCPPNGI